MELTIKTEKKVEIDLPDGMYYLGYSYKGEFHNITMYEVRNARVINIITCGKKFKIDSSSTLDNSLLIPDHYTEFLCQQKYILSGESIGDLTNDSIHFTNKQTFQQFFLRVYKNVQDLVLNNTDI